MKNYLLIDEEAEKKFAKILNKDKDKIKAESALLNPQKGI
jgi:hypothetical protein